MNRFNGIQAALSGIGEQPHLTKAFGQLQKRGRREAFFTPPYYSYRLLLK